MLIRDFKAGKKFKNKSGVLFTMSNGIVPHATLGECYIAIYDVINIRLIPTTSSEQFFPCDENGELIPEYKPYTLETFPVSLIGKIIQYLDYSGHYNLEVISLTKNGITAREVGRTQVYDYSFQVLCDSFTFNGKPIGIKNV